MRVNLQEVIENLLEDAEPRVLVCAPDSATTLGEIAQLRREYAELFGFKSYADFTLRRRMAESTANTQRFLDDVKAVLTEREVRDLGGREEHRRGVGAGGHAGATADAGGRVEGVVVRHVQLAPLRHQALEGAEVQVAPALIQSTICLPCAAVSSPEGGIRSPSSVAKIRCTIRLASGSLGTSAGSPESPPAAASSNDVSCSPPSAFSS